MWYTVLIIVHVLACVFLTVVVLLQAGKGSDISAVFGGSSQTLFGSSGASTFLSKLTTWIAVVFMATSLTLTYGAAKRTTRSVFDDVPVDAPAPASTESAPQTQSGASTESQRAATPPAASESAQTKPAAPAPTAPAPAAPIPAPAQQPPPAAAPEPAPK